jgi:glyoxylase-like metal-dependent hydrolase (beta-lactamase superfamily II)
MKEVFPDIFWIKESGAFKAMKPPVNIYVIAGGRDSLIYDAGYGDKKTIKKVINDIKNITEIYKARNKEFKIASILPSHSHPDHISGLKLLRANLGIKIILTNQIAEIIQSKKSYSSSFDPDTLEDLFIKRRFWGKIKSKFLDFIWWIIYRRVYGMKFLNDPEEIIDNECEITINNEVWKIFSSPGHSNDHISLYNEKKGVLLSGDNVIDNITTWLGPPKSDIEEYIRTIEFLTLLPNLNLILSAHGRPIKNPKKRLQDILNHRNQRTHQVLMLVKNHANDGITPSEIIRELYPKGGKMIQEIARGWVCLTLKILEQKKLIYRIINKKSVKFFSTNKI